MCVDFWKKLSTIKNLHLQHTGYQCQTDLPLEKMPYVICQLFYINNIAKSIVILKTNIAYCCKLFFWYYTLQKCGYIFAATQNTNGGWWSLFLLFCVDSVSLVQTFQYKCFTWNNETVVFHNITYNTDIFNTAGCLRPKILVFTPKYLLYEIYNLEYFSFLFDDPRTNTVGGKG